MEHYYEEVKKESVDSTLYIDFEDEMHCIKGFIDGGHDFKDYGEISPRMIEQALNDIDCGYDKLSDISFKLPKVNGKKYSPKELGIVKNIILNNIWYGHDKYDSVSAVLEIIYGVKYINTVLHGYCQGDWVIAYLPKRIATNKYIEWLETMYFNTGK